jgi:hypothetical protein
MSVNMIAASLRCSVLEFIASDTPPDQLATAGLGIGVRIHCQNCVVELLIFLTRGAAAPA